MGDVVVGWLIQLINLFFGDGGTIVNEFGDLIGDVVVVRCLVEFEFGEGAACVSNFLIFVESVDGIFHGLLAGLQEESGGIDV